MTSFSQSYCHQHRCLIFVDPFESGEAEMSSMGSMDSLFDAFDNSSVGDLLDIQNSVAFLSRVFGKIWFSVSVRDSKSQMAIFR